jgi:hypothetical protein
MQCFIKVNITGNEVTFVSCEFVNHLDYGDKYVFNMCWNLSVGTIYIYIWSLVYINNTLLSYSKQICYVWGKNI